MSSSAAPPPDEQGVFRSMVTNAQPETIGSSGATPVDSAEHPIDQPINVLETSGLIRLAAIQPELEYLFRHVLVQDAAYESLLKQERRRLHLAVAEALEALYPDRRNELTPMLAL